MFDSKQYQMLEVFNFYKFTAFDCKVKYYQFSIDIIFVDDFSYDTSRLIFDSLYGKYFLVNDVFKMGRFNEVLL